MSENEPKDGTTTDAGTDLAGRLEPLVMRFLKLREELFAAIDYAISKDGHHKSYEGRFTIVFPHRFTDAWEIELACYVIGPSRSYFWSGKTLEEALEACERDVRQWIKDEYEHDYESAWA